MTVFQPHRFSRTNDLFDEFSQVLADSDVLVLTDIYAAGEKPIDGIDSGALCQSVRARGRVNPVLISNVSDLPSELPLMLEDGDLVLLLGAGNIGHIAQEIREKGFLLEAVAMTGVPALKIRDADDFGRVGLVIGGSSAERQVSLDGGNSVAAALGRNGVNHLIFDGPLALFEAIHQGEIDRVFNLLHGPDGEDGSLQGALAADEDPRNRRRSCLHPP